MDHFNIYFMHFTFLHIDTINAKEERKREGGGGGALKFSQWSTVSMPFKLLLKCSQKYKFFFVVIS